jgi:uncharacterized protein DUF4157
VKHQDCLLKHQMYRNLILFFEFKGKKSSHPIKSPADRILFLQRTIGNQAVQRLIKSGTLQAKLKIGQPGDKYEQEADRVADAVMRMPEPGVQRQVEPEEEEEETLQSKPLVNQISPLVQVQRQEEPEEEEEMLQAKPLAEEITPLVQRQVEPEEEEEELQAKATSEHISEANPNLESHIHSLKGGGQPLSENDRAFFEPRFGYDFSQVRVHTDTRAAHLARSVDASAFTLGSDVVFGAGQYSQSARSGRKLLAHELTHIVQQNDKSNISQERKNIPVQQQRTIGGLLVSKGYPENRTRLIQRGKANKIDKKAQAIINAAQNTKIPIKKRAIQAVNNIIKTYFPSQAGMVKKVVYKASEPGLEVSAASTPKAKGTITVGDYFVKNTNKKRLARRVLQVDHEFEHIRQQRQGLGGPQRKHLREFLSFTREALSPEKPGTGRVSHSTRVALIDAALKNYSKLKNKEKIMYKKKCVNLIAARKTHSAKSGRKHPHPPSSCP